MKKVLIISPHFPPTNAADMHRVRQSLPYFENFGWEPEVLTVAPEFVEGAMDELLLQSIPQHIKVHKVDAYPIKYTRKVGLGNLGLRAFRQLFVKGNKLLEAGKFDLVYFSTTMFACIPLGRIWKKRYHIPFIVDMQDPWRNDYYLTVPKNEKPPKFWFAYQLDKTLEKFTIPETDGLISVSQGYIDVLKSRYSAIKNIPEKVLTFGAAENDFNIVSKLKIAPSIALNRTTIDIVYIGRGGHDMQKSISLLFESFQKGLITNNKFKNIKFWFVGTSYAPNGKGEKTILPIAKKYAVDAYVEEITDRKPYFEVLSILKNSDVIVIPGSDDENYTASKLYPNILAKKPMLCIFHSQSSVVKIVKELNAGKVVLFDKENALENCTEQLSSIVNALPFTPNTDWNRFDEFTAQSRTREQCLFFNEVLSYIK